jgi:hypothetical protein
MMEVGIREDYEGWLLRCRPVAIDASAESSQKDTPGFFARPAGAPVYHGFRTLDDVVVDGFTFCAMTDFEAEPCGGGDAFVSSAQVCLV